jgi:hypothetical protein
MAPEIIEFWRKNLKIQMDARIGVIYIDAEGISTLISIFLP